MPVISTTTINIADVEKWCRNADPGVKMALIHLTESQIATEQLLKDLFSQMELFAQAAIINSQAQQILMKNMNNIAKRNDNTGMVSFGKPGED